MACQSTCPHRARFKQTILASVLIAGCIGSRLHAAAVTSMSKDSDGITCILDGGANLRLQVWSDRIIRATYSPRPTQLPASFAVNSKPVATHWTLIDDAKELDLATSALHAHVDRATGTVSFTDLAGKPILSEASDPTARSFAPSAAKKVQGTSAGQSFLLQPDEAIFGLGQHPNGVWNHRGTSVHLQQRNADIAVPVLMSSKGYGLLWDNPAITDVSVGTHDKPDRVDWLSESGDAVDYYFLFGPSADDVVRDYRALTGAVPMWGKWALGYWQSRERFVTQNELLDVAREYRKRQIPIDGMVQDWQYWFPQPWGSHAFGTNFPDAPAMMKELHDSHFHAIISVWAKFDQGSKNYEELEAAGALYPPIYPNVYPKGNAKWYDAFNPEARKLYWREMSDQIFAKGFDGWWLDATEPELGGKWGELRDLQTKAGPGYKVFNAYPLMTTSAVYEGQRAQTSDQRAFILTRSAYAGQQRNASVVWSGDINSDWATFQRQIPGGLNFVLTGMPYWNTDIGGFFSRATDDGDYRECFTRWFEFGAFCPMFRVHGTNAQKEMWKFGPDVEKVLVKYDQLRYRLLPYIYSTAWRVTNDSDTMMRPLVMDFADDPKALAVGDQYLFGPAIMVCPVTTPAGAGTIIPGASFADLDGKPGALSATYYQGMNFETKVAQRRDEMIAFDWDKKKREGVGENLQRDPIPGLEMDRFSARWEGSVLTGDAGTYTFTLRADDGMRMWVDGKLIVDDWNARSAATKSATIDLPAKTRVPIKVEYFQNIAPALIDLSWSLPTKGHEVFMRKTYLPQGKWFDFWTGESIEGGRSIDAPAPLETMPLFVRAGSIVPMGPIVQYASEKADPIEVRVYAGHDGAFTLYDDEGDNYNYEKGAHATIPFTWNDQTGTPTIGDRVGTFAGMMSERTFNIVFVHPGRGSGAEVVERPDRRVQYAGKQIEVIPAHP